MTVIKALEELKASLESCRRTEMVEKPFDTYWITVDACNACIEALEAEIAERFMELPVDADGVPIHVGDELETVHDGKAIVEYVGECEVRVYRDGEHYRISQDEYAYTCHHFKQRTIEDVLRDVWKEALDYAKSDMWRNPDEVFSERADEICRLLGVDE